jgi:phosphatidylglycerophosphate synthase
MGQTSRLGAFLDPVADKLIVAVALVLLLSKEMPMIIVPGLEGMDGARATLRAETVQVILVLCSIVIIGREIAISALREWMAEIGKSGKVKVSQLAKYKTILQIVGLSCMLFRWNLTILPGVSLPIFEIGLVLTVIAAFLTLISAISYLRAAWPEMRGHS